jgi:hypothetical protein
MTNALQSLSANESRQGAFLWKPSRMLLNCLKIGDRRARATFQALSHWPSADDL